MAGFKNICLDWNMSGDHVDCCDVNDDKEKWFGIAAHALAIVSIVIPLSFLVMNSEMDSTDIRGKVILGLSRLYPTFISGYWMVVSFKNVPVGSVGDKATRVSIGILNLVFILLGAWYLTSMAEGSLFPLFFGVGLTATLYPLYFVFGWIPGTKHTDDVSRRVIGVMAAISLGVCGVSFFAWRRDVVPLRVGVGALALAVLLMAVNSIRDEFGLGFKEKEEYVFWMDWVTILIFIGAIVLVVGYGCLLWKSMIRKLAPGLLKEFSSGSRRAMNNYFPC